MKIRIKYTKLSHRLAYFAAILCISFVATTAWGAKAISTPLTVTQSDGTTITVFLHGDENFSWYTDTQGNILEREGNDFYKMNITHDEFFANAKASIRKSRARRANIGTTTPAYFPHMGSPKALVILVDFQKKDENDSTAYFTVTDPKKTFEQYLNGEGRHQNFGYREDRNYGSVKQYFNDMSNGQFTPKFDIVGPYRVSKPASYYGENKSGSKDINFSELIREACQLAHDNGTDFSQYDADGDGNVDLVYIIYAGYGENSGAQDWTIWPKSGTGSYGTYDGKNVRRYGVNNELNYNPNKKLAFPWRRINGIGLFCHEFSHTLGLPDLYSELPIDNQEMEYWSLMDGGEYTDNSYTPTPYTPWEKSVMGWTTLNALSDTEPSQVTLQNDEAVKIQGPTEENYLILHNTQYEGWRSGNSKQGIGLFGHGMLVYRINYQRTKVNLGDYPNAMSGKPQVTVIPADGLLISSYRVIETGEQISENKIYDQTQYIQSMSSDPFPGTQNIDRLTDEMNLPNFFWGFDASQKINRPIYNIKDENGVITFDYLKNISTHINDVITVTETDIDNRIYSIDGRYVGNNTDGLPKGLYIRNHKKFVLK